MLLMLTPREILIYGMAFFFFYPKSFMNPLV